MPVPVSLLLANRYTCCFWQAPFSPWFRSKPKGHSHLFASHVISGADWFPLLGVQPANMVSCLDLCDILLSTLLPFVAGVLVGTWRIQVDNIGLVALPHAATAQSILHHFPAAQWNPFSLCFGKGFPLQSNARRGCPCLPMATGLLRYAQVEGCHHCLSLAGEQHAS